MFAIEITSPRITRNNTNKIPFTKLHLLQLLIVVFMQAELAELSQNGKVPQKVNGDKLLVLSVLF